MKKNKFYCGKLISLLIAPSISTTLLVTSCSKKTYVLLDQQYFYTESKEQLITLKTHGKIKKIMVELVDSTSKSIFIKDKIIDVINNSADILVCTDDLYCNTPLETKFNLNVTIIDSDGFISTQKCEGFTIYFENKTPERKDPITCNKHIFTLTGTYSVDIPLIFDVEPKSEIYIKLIEPKNKLILKTEHIKLVEDPDPSHYGWWGHVLIDLPLSLYHAELFDFSLQLHFINSYNEQQITVLDNFVVNYLKSHDKSIPIEYYDIQDGTLNGFKPNFSKDRIINECDTITIPDGVVKIKNSAFGSENSRSMFGINKIIFPKTVEDIEENAFAGCVNAFEIDISSYDKDITPKWIQQDVKIFAGEKLLRPLGYIWTSKFDYDSEDFVQHFVKIGLISTWSAMRFDQVTPPDLFLTEVKQNNITGEQHKTIKSVNPKYLDYLWYYSIIKIPSDVNEIAAWSFISNFGEILYLQHGKSSKPQTRRLVFDPNNKMELINSFAFSNCGIGGPIYIPIMNRPNSYISVMSEFTFENLGRYNNAHGAAFQHEPIEILFENKAIETTIPSNFISFTTGYDNKISRIVLPSNLKNISDYGFMSTNCTSQLVLPNLIKNIGSFAFTNNEFSGELILTPNLTNIGARAFSYHKLKTLRFKTWNYITDPEKPGSLKISQLETVGDEAFGSDVHEHEGWISGNKTLELIDLSMYPIASPDPTIPTTVEVPGWLKNQNSSRIFAFACNSDKGKVILSSTMFKSENAQILNEFKQALYNHGVPTTWTFTDKEE